MLVLLLYESTLASKMDLHNCNRWTKRSSSLVLGRKLFYNFLVHLMFAGSFHIPHGLPILLRTLKFLYEIALERVFKKVS